MTTAARQRGKGEERRVAALSTVPVEAASLISFTIYGDAEPSGSKTRTRWGIREDNPKAADYRVKVAQECGREMAAQGATLIRKPTPVVLDVEFIRRRPDSHWRKRTDANGHPMLSAEGQRNPYPTTKPDRGKVLRTIEDGLTGVLYEDDAQVTDGYVSKRWAHHGEPACARVLAHIVLTVPAAATTAEVAGAA